MKYIIRVTDYHYGGHVLYIKLVNTDAIYKLTSHQDRANIFTAPKQLDEICDLLNNNENAIANSRRTVERELILDNDTIDQLNAI